MLLGADRNDVLQAVVIPPPFGRPDDSVVIVGVDPPGGQLIRVQVGIRHLPVAGQRDFSVPVIVDLAEVNVRRLLAVRRDNSVLSAQVRRKTRPMRKRHPHGSGVHHQLAGGTLPQQLVMDVTVNGSLSNGVEG